MNKYTLPNLPYGFDALEPHIDARTMEIHHGKHHAGYVSKLNAALEKHPALFEVPLNTLLANLHSVPGDIRDEVRNNGGGHLNHSLFWNILSPGAGGEPAGTLSQALIKKYDTPDSFRKEFEKAATARFGSGWAWLSLNAFSDLVVHSTPNQDNPVMDGLIPIIGLDVWEHAYYLNYQNRRPDYITAFWKLVNWKQAEINYLNALNDIDSCMTVSGIRKAS